jgi:large subunit ribosomal protein L18
VNYNQEGDRVLTSALSSDLVKLFKWNYSVSTTPAAYLTGLLAGKRAQEKGITEGILDIGRYRPTKGNKFFAALKGVVDAGVKCPYDEVMIPSDDRITGSHLQKEISTAVDKIKGKLIGGK